MIFKKPLDEIERQERNRAALIGRDQVGKLNGRISEYEQRQLGIEEYIWVTAGDERVRASHRALNGHKFKWSDPPPEGNPGYPIQCRCIADPIIDMDKINLTPKAGSYLSSGLGAEDFETTIVNVEPFNYSNNAAVEARFSQFVKELAQGDEKREYALVITKNNKCTTLRGGVGTVNIGMAGPDLKGAKVIHNHPNTDGFFGDCFSREDMEKLIEYDLDFLEVASGLGRYRVGIRAKK